MPAPPSAATSSISPTPTGRRASRSSSLPMCGSLITIGGTSGRKPEAAFTIGSSVNAACAAFTKALAHRGKEDGVQVNCIHPSFVETDRQWRRIKAEMERTGAGEMAVRQRITREAGITRFGKVEDVAD